MVRVARMNCAHVVAFVPHSKIPRKLDGFSVEAVDCVFYVCRYVGRLSNKPKRLGPTGGSGNSDALVIYGASRYSDMQFSIIAATTARVNSPRRCRTHSRLGCRSHCRPCSESG